MGKAISAAVIRRLPKYYRYLGLLEEKGKERVSSQELSEITGFTASQIRQDFNHFGGFGQQGYGYRVENLRQHIAEIIGLDRTYKVAIVGMGHLGLALANSTLFQHSSFCLCALYDNDEEKVGNQVCGLSISGVSDLKRDLAAKKIDILTITTPKSVAQTMVDLAEDAGVKGIWNFALTDLKRSGKAVIENVYLKESLHTLSYYMGNQQDYKD